MKIDHPENRPIRKALLSLSNKEKLKELAQFLTEHKCELVATTSTRHALLELGFDCAPVEDISQFPEILGGRVKTLHPKIFGGILAQPQLAEHATDLKKYAIPTFDLVVCNLYPFQSVLAKQVDNDTLIENIDIGGVSLLRAAAKNFKNVTILCDPQDYERFITILKENHFCCPLEIRKELALKAFRETSTYDRIIATALEHALAPTCMLESKQGPVGKESTCANELLPESIQLSLTKMKSLRYGENPHQKAALYELAEVDSSKNCVLSQLNCCHGKELSYNNVLDIEHAIRLISEFQNDAHACAILKHNTPCGVGISHLSIAESFDRAFAGDTVSPFGGIVCVNSEVTEELAQRLYEIFLEVIVAPHFTPQALEFLQRKKNLRLVTFNPKLPLANKILFTAVQGGFLAQESDDIVFNVNQLQVVSGPTPTIEDIKAMNFAMAVVKHVRSNAIAFTTQNQTLAIAGGFTNRVDAVHHCLRSAKLSLFGSTLASDAFFPFPDSIELIKNTGVRWIVQPGGSVQDHAVIEACQKHQIGMALTGARHFKH